MNSWPTLKEWIQFGGIVALEVVIVFAVAKLATLRIRSAQWRRALWQMALVAMLIIVVGELSGVRDLARSPEKPKAEVLPPRQVVVTIKEPDMTFPLPSALFPTAPPLVQFPPPTISLWQQQVAWPTAVWLAGIVLVLCRGVFAQITGLVLRLSCRRTADSELNERVERICAVLRIRRRVSLLESARAAAPFTFGVWKPVIVLPRRFTETFTADQQEVALAHELAHVAGFDSAWRSMSDFVCALLWWHPLAWQAKRELGQASEFVADEASLLLADGPNRLAECLVACAKGLRPPAFTTWLGINGGGFRSGLGKRVTRLLQLQRADSIACRVPWYLRLVAPVICAGLLWTGMVAVVDPGEARGGVWRGSILASAFAAAAEDKPAKPAQATVTNAVGQIADGPREEEPKSNARVVTSQARQEVFTKLRRTRLNEWGPIDNLPLSQVVRQLADEIRRRDPQQKGVSFMISSAAPGTVDPAGLPVGPSRTNLNAATVRLGTVLKDLSVEDVLNILCKIADPRMQYSVEDYGVIISALADGPSPLPLHTRYFRVDTNTFPQQLQTLRGPSTNAQPRHGKLSNTNSFLTEVVPAETVIPAARDLFGRIDIDLTVPGKAVFYNDRLGILMVRATWEDLEKISKALQPMIIESPAGFFPSAKTNAAVPSAETTRSEAARLTQDGKLYYETDRLKEAEDSLQAALKVEPKHAGAAYYLDLVRARQFSIETRLREVPLKKLAEVEQEWVQPVNKDRTGSQVPTDPAALHTRFFKVDPNTFQQGLSSVLAFDFKSGRSQLAVGKFTNLNDLVSVLQSFFKRAGADLTAEGKSVFFNDRAGTLMVRATLSDLDTVEKAMQLLNMSPQQLTIRVKVFEVDKAENGSAFDWFLGTLVTNEAASSYTPPRERRPLGAMPQEMLTKGLRTTNAAARAPTITGILTDEQFRKMVRTLEQRGVSDMLSAPEVTTMSGRQAQIKVVDVRYIVTGMDHSTNVTSAKSSPGIGEMIIPIAEPFEIGPVVDIVPYVMGDGMTIQMTVLPTVREFLGYDDPGEFVISVKQRKANEPETLTQPTPLPRFRLRQVATTAMVWDGQTLMLSAGTSRQEKKTRDASGKVTTTFKDKELFYFITPRIVDPAGNPLHSQNELEETHSRGVPKQAPK